MTRSHGIVRGASEVDRSPRNKARFGRMFRWLEGETYDRADLKNLATIMIQKEKAHVRTPAEAGLPPVAAVSEGPDIVFNAVPAETASLDTAYGEPEAGDENPTIPAGFTYFGQFIDHDLTFDPNSSLQKQNDPDATDDFRTPRFDLDSVYGRGPDDQPYLYKDHQTEGGGIRFLLGRSDRFPATERPGELPRNVEGRSLTGDPRNDENGIICQVQALFLNFHNRVVDTLEVARPNLDRHTLFTTAQRIVRWHYQYLILNDYLPRVVGEATWKRVYLGGGLTPHPHIEFYKPHDGDAYMPIEFSVAAFRFGHSMVRPSYALRRGDARVGGDPVVPFEGDPKGRFFRIPIFSDIVDPLASLNGFGPLPPAWEIDWNMFFSSAEMATQITADGPDRGILGVVPQTDEHRTQPGYRVDTQIVDPLAMLPPDVAKSGNMPDGIPSLAYRNLLRSSAFALPSGQNVARAFDIPVLTEEELWADTKGAPRGFDFSVEATNPFAFRAPLWYYILKEAELTRKAGSVDAKGGHHLGPVGGRIVAEVLVGIAINDHTSFLYQDRNWTPDTEAARSGFKPDASISTMFDLIKWTTKGTMTLA